MDKKVTIMYEKVRTILAHHQKNEEILKEMIDFCLYKLFLSRASAGEPISPDVFALVKLIKKDIEMAKNHKSVEEAMKDSEYYEEIVSFFNN